MTSVMSATVVVAGRVSQCSGVCRVISRRLPAQLVERRADLVQLLDYCRQRLVDGIHLRLVGRLELLAGAVRPAIVTEYRHVGFPPRRDATDVVGQHRKMPAPVT